jgi:hypothetical protein
VSEQKRRDPCEKQRLVSPNEQDVPDPAERKRRNDQKCVHRRTGIQYPDREERGARCDFCRQNKFLPGLPVSENIARSECEA